MNKIIDYNLVAGPTHERFSERMANRIQDGWQPFGSASCVHLESRYDGHGTHDVYTQAVVKYE
jgi:hypothetical protein